MELDDGTVAVKYLEESKYWTAPRERAWMRRRRASSSFVPLIGTFAALHMDCRDFKRTSFSKGSAAAGRVGEEEDDGTVGASSIEVERSATTEEQDEEEDGMKVGVDKETGMKQNAEKQGSDIAKSNSNSTVTVTVPLVDVVFVEVL